MKSALEMFCS